MAKPLPSGYTDDEIDQMFDQKKNIQISNIPEDIINDKCVFRWSVYHSKIMSGTFQILQNLVQSGLYNISELNKITIYISYLEISLYIPELNRYIIIKTTCKPDWIEYATYFDPPLEEEYYEELKIIINHNGLDKLCLTRAILYECNLCDFILDIKNRVKEGAIEMNKS